MIETLFSPVCGKSLLRRTNLEVVNVSPPSFDTSSTSQTKKFPSNPYILFLNAGYANIRPMTEFIDEMSNIVSTFYDAKFQLGAVPSDLSGVAILTHAYTTMALPTWHYLAIANDETAKKQVDADAFATITKFLADAPLPENKIIKYDSDALKKLTSLLYLTNGSSYNAALDPDTEISFEADRNTAPDCLWLQPYTRGDAAVYYSMICGLLIESYEVDGSSVPLPNPDEAFRLQNSQFLQGSAPLSAIHKGTDTAGLVAFNRNAMKARAQKISHDLRDSSEHRIPSLCAEVVESTVPTRIPGFKLITGLSGFLTGYNKLSWNTADTTGPPDTLADTRPLPVWTPYRHLIVETDDTPSSHHIYAMFNHRTLYGTSVLLDKTIHPSVLIPIS
jgi:hypothetical protein